MKENLNLGQKCVVPDGNVSTAATTVPTAHVDTPKFSKIPAMIPLPVLSGSRLAIAT